MKSISIVMATFNGEKYIKDQLDSIVAYLDPIDELIISDDGSNDNTLEIINDYARKYGFIKIYQGPKKGVVKNFEFALSKASRDIVLICDQDDVWMPNKINKIREVFSENNNLFLVLHDMYISNDYKIDNGIEGESSFGRRKRKHGVFYNWIYSGYFGCCMGLSKEFLLKILPFSKHVNLYDQWIGMLAEHYKSSLFIPDKLIIHREHSDNVSKNKTSLWFKLKTRFVSFVAYLEKKK